MSYSKLSAKHLLPAWIKHLVAQHEQIDPPYAWVVGRGGGRVDGEAQGGPPRGIPVQKKSQLTSQLKSQLTEL